MWHVYAFEHEKMSASNAEATNDLPDEMTQYTDPWRALVFVYSLIRINSVDLPARLGADQTRLLL